MEIVQSNLGRYLQIFKIRWVPTEVEGGKFVVIINKRFIEVIGYLLTLAFSIDKFSKFNGSSFSLPFKELLIALQNWKISYLFVRKT